MGGLNKCAVYGCQINSLPRHRFPNFKKDFSRFQKWLNILQDENLNAMTPEDVYEKKRVCHNHFEEKYVSPGTKRLHIDALPTLFIHKRSASGTTNLLLPPDRNIEIPSSYILETNESEETTVGTSSNARALETNAEISPKLSEETTAGTSSNARALETTNAEICSSNSENMATAGRKG